MTSSSAAARPVRVPRFQGRTRGLLNSPVATYYLLATVTALLIGIGLVMVLSASMIVSINSTSGSPYTVFISQLIFAVIGLIALVAAARTPLAVWARLGGVALVVTVVLQLLVFTPLGTGVQGNRNWLDLKVLTIQPSELGKIALVLFGARVLTQKRRVLGVFKEAIVPFVFPAATLVLLLVMLGRDLGTAIVLAALVAGMIFAAGVRLRWFDICRQPVHAKFALADGGWTGTGLGAGKEKWQWLSEPHNDFIFAVIGEEIGLIGTLVILALFAAFAYAAYRLVVRSDDFFVRIAATGVMTWIVVQAIINIGAVIGTLPIIGVPLPFVSSGGSSLITSMAAAGMLLAFARAEPGCAEQLAARPRMVRGASTVLAPWRRRRG